MPVIVAGIMHNATVTQPLDDDVSCGSCRHSERCVCRLQRDAHHYACAGREKSQMVKKTNILAGTRCSYIEVPQSIWHSTCILDDEVTTSSFTVIEDTTTQFTATTTTTTTTAIDVTSSLLADAADDDAKPYYRRQYFIVIAGVLAGLFVVLLAGLYCLTLVVCAKKPKPRQAG